MDRRLLPLISLGLCLALSGTTAAQTRQLRPVGGVSADTTAQARTIKQRGAEPMVAMIVKFKAAGLASYDGSINGLPATSPRVTGRALDVNSAPSRLYLAYLDRERQRVEAAMAAVAPAATVVHDLSIAVGAVSVVVPRSQLEALRALPDVEGVYEDRLEQPETYRSAAFIGAPAAWARLGGQASAGEGVIVGVLDSGIWPESPSFSDPDASGKPYAAPPAKWQGTSCEFGSAVPGDAPFTCNNKLIGAKRFMATYQAVTGITPTEFASARDDDGHGTHTASTAAGNGNIPVTLRGRTYDPITGVAPRAHVVAYKVCGEAGCYSSDSAAAVQQAIVDGVDVLNFSISGGSNPFADVVEAAFLDAYNAGVFVAASAGNSGPGANTVDHRSPWVTTVAASTTDRTFEATLTVAGAPTALILKGQSTTLTGVPTAAEVVRLAGDPLCQSAAAPGSLTGKIVACARGVNARTNKSDNVAAGGAVGMILYNTSLSSLDLDAHTIPTVHLQADEGAQFLAFLTANPGTTATISPAVLASQQGDVVAGFSSRGGSGLALGVLKPDIAAPGVAILAGASPMPSSGTQGDLFAFQSGTSMASPHIAGAAALVKALRPTWTPGEIKSALMTSSVTAMTKEDGVTAATPFDQGAGRVDLSKASDPGITFSAPGATFVALQSNLAVANQPSVYVPNIPGKVSIVRSVKSQLTVGKTWRITAASDPGLSVTVPSLLFVPANGSANLIVALDASATAVGQTRHARLSMVTTDGSHRATMPISIVRRDGGTIVAQTCDDADFLVGEFANCQVTMSNDTYVAQTVALRDKLPSQIKLAGPPTGPTGTTYVGPQEFRFNGTLAPKAARPITVARVPGGSPGGYLPLSLFGIAPIAGVGDESIHNFNVPAFTYNGATYTRIGIVSNGYVVVGGGTASDISFVNPSMPDAARPNNVLAPFWTDLNPAFGGAVRIGTLTDGVTTWLVVDFAAVANYSDRAPNSFEVWIRLGTVEDVTFTYGAITGGEAGFVTVGAEDAEGRSGYTYFKDGTGAAVVAGDELVVSSAPGAAGESKTISFTVTGAARGAWTNCAELTATTLFGTATSCVSGIVR